MSYSELRKICLNLFFDLILPLTPIDVDVIISMIHEFCMLERIPNSADMLLCKSFDVDSVFY